ncbi:D-hexose-6-phosphate mutarotase [Neptuniibacter sp. QD34_54]|uniref:D-hexose-6-phosphate mutarotase n=1 Tax=Neptuniibacter sp. QD34_54 TaxID=3398208 RepID=UPI0039F498B4
MNLADQVQALYAKYGALKGITIEIHKQLIAIAVKNEAASATIFLQGAQVAEYSRIGEQPVLWLSQENDFKAGKSLRGGVPICWPWFGDLSRNPDQVKDQVNLSEAPAHGFVRSEDWELLAIDLIDSETTRLTLQLEVLPTELWPYPAVLRLTVTVGVELDLELKVKNLGSDAFSYTSALHSYLQIGHVSETAIEGLEAVEYIDTLEDWQVKQSNSAIGISAETDRIYPNIPAQVAIKDKQMRRQILMSADNLPDMVVWNPWIDKSKRLSHFADNDYENMVCLENASVLDNAVELAPGSDSISKVSIRSVRL